MIPVRENSEVVMKFTQNHYPMTKLQRCQLHQLWPRGKTPRWPARYRQLLARACLRYPVKGPSPNECWRTHWDIYTWTLQKIGTRKRHFNVNNFLEKWSAEAACFYSNILDIVSKNGGLQPNIVNFPCTCQCRINQPPFVGIACTNFTSNLQYRYVGVTSQSIGAYLSGVRIANQ